MAQSFEIGPFVLAGLAQWVEQLPCKQRVAGSTPATSTTERAVCQRLGRVARPDENPR